MALPIIGSPSSNNGDGRLKFEIMIVNNNPMLEALSRNQHTLLTATMVTRDTAIQAAAALSVELLELKGMLAVVMKSLGLEEINGTTGDTTTADGAEATGAGIPESR